MTPIPRDIVRVFVLGTILGVFAGSAAAQVDCDVPDDLCVGDPCVVPNLLVGSPCVIDFGARSLVIDGALRLPPNGVLSLTAAGITVRGEIRNLPDGDNLGGAGPEIRLVATGAIDVPGRLRLNGRLSGVAGTVPGQLEIDAGGALSLGGTILASTGPTTLTLDAGGAVTIARSIVSRAAGSVLAVTAGDRVDMTGRLRVPAVDIDAVGDVLITGSFGRLEVGSILSGGALAIESAVRAHGATVDLNGAAGVTITRRLDLSTLFTNDGGVNIASPAGDVVIDDIVRANAVDVSAAGSVLIRAIVSTSNPTRSAGSMTIAGGTGVAIEADLTATGGDGTAPMDGAGGDVVITSGGAVAVTRNLRVNAFPGSDVPAGRVQITGASVTIGPAVNVEARGCRGAGPCDFFRPPAEIRATGATGAVVLDGTFTATGGASVIEGTAAGDLVAAGEFTAGADGCIAFAAGGVLDIAGATLDGPLVTDCP